MTSGAQPVCGPRQFRKPVYHCPTRDPQHPCDLGVFQPLHVAEPPCQADLLRDGFEESQKEVAISERLLGILSGALGQLGHRLGSTVCVTELVEAIRGCNSVDPRQRFVDVLHFLQVLVGADEGFLGGILRSGFVGQDLEAPCVDEGPVGEVERHPSVIGHEGGPSGLRTRFL